MDKDYMALDGVRVRGVGAGISPSDIKVYFSNPRNGGGRVSKIFYPLLNHTAVVIFADRNGITSRRHKIKNCDVTVESLPNNIFSKVSVELEPETTQILDQNSSYLDILQFEGELDVNFDPDSMNYIMIGNWYQVEWAWNYLESVSKEKTTPAACLSKSEGPKNKSNMLSLITPNIPSKGGDSRASTSDDVPKNFAETTGEQSNIAWNINRQQDSNISVRYAPFKNHKIQPRVDKFRIGDSNQKQRIGMSDAHIPLLDNPLRGKDMWTSNYPQHGGYVSDDTDDELAASYLDDRSSSPEIFVPDRPVTRLRGHSPKGIELLHSDFGDMPLTFDAFVKGLQVKVIMGDIVKERSDAIVNPTNQNLSNTYGISAAIARMAGRGLMDECRNYLSRHGPLEVGQVTKTCAGGALDSQVDFVLHTVPPTWRENESDSTSHILTCTYLNCLQVANKQLWLRSLSFPIIGSGGLGVPLDVSVQAFFDAVHLYVSDEKQTTHLRSVQLVSNTQDSTCSVIVVLRSLLDLDQGESQKGAIDRYLTRSEEFDFRAKDFWLDKEKNDGKVKVGDEKRDVPTVEDRKLDVPVEERDPDAAISVTIKGSGVHIQKNRGDGILGLENQDEEGHISSNRGQGFNIQQDKVDSFSNAHQSRGTSKPDQTLHEEGDNGHIDQDKDIVELQDEYETDKEKVSVVLTNQESTENDVSRLSVGSDGKSIWTQGDRVASQRNDRFDEFAGGDDDFTYKVDADSGMLEKAEESTEKNEEENQITRRGADSDSKSETGITDGDTLTVNDSVSQPILSAGSDLAQGMPSSDRQDL